MNVEEEIKNIKNRNRLVEYNKAWETSWFRRSTIAAFTYIIAGAWLMTIDNPNPWLNAFVPTGGYFLSTFSLPFIKKWWIKNLS